MTGPDLSRLSLNQYTTHEWSAREAIEGCRRAGLGWIGLWRDKVAEQGLDETARLLGDNGIRCSGLCRGGMFTYADKSERKGKIDDNLRAIDEAAALKAETLVLVCGGPAPDSIDDARKMVEEGIAEVLPHAEKCGVRLGIEPLHPMQVERSVVSTLALALDIADRLTSPNVGVVIDTYHVWWDPDRYEQIRRASGRIFSFHVNDWLNPTTDVFMTRGMMGDGVIEIRKLREAVDAAGYTGPIECEIFSTDIWQQQGNAVLETMKQRYLEHC